MEATSYLYIVLILSIELLLENASGIWMNDTNHIGLEIDCARVSRKKNIFDTCDTTDWNYIICI